MRNSRNRRFYFRQRRCTRLQRGIQHLFGLFPSPHLLIAFILSFILGTGVPVWAIAQPHQKNLSAPPPVYSPPGLDPQRLFAPQPPIDDLPLLWSEGGLPNRFKSIASLPLQDSKSPRIGGFRGRQNLSHSSENVSVQDRAILQRAELQQEQPQSQTESRSGRSLLQQGIDRYDTERFSEAVRLWQQSLSALQAEGDRLGQALALSNLSLAYQQLGQPQAAQGAIAESLALLETVEQSDRSAAYLDILAKALNTQGNWLWSQGQAEPALQVWQQAAQRYQEAGNRSGTLTAQLNQSKALQDLGLNTQAVDLLQQVSQQLTQEPIANLKAAGLRYLGEAYRRVGELEQARRTLRASVETAQPPDSKAAALLELGNVEKLLSDRARAIGEVTQAQTYTQAAIRSYQAAIQSSDALPLQLQSKLNQLTLLIGTGQWSEVDALLPQIQPLVAQLPPSRTAIYAQLNYAASLSCLKQLASPQRSSPPVSSIQNAACLSLDRLEDLQTPTELGSLPTWETIARQVMAAVEQSRSLEDAIAESYALGRLGNLYELNQRWTDAQNLTQQALLRLEGIQAPEISYQWLWQLGRLLAQQGQKPEAIASYQEAIRSLEAAQRDLLLINEEAQFSFRDKVEPVYREFVELLLTASGSQPDQEGLKRAIQTIDALQLVELKNFLGCELPLVRIDESSLDPAAAKIYPIVLPDRLAIIFEVAGQPLTYSETRVGQQEFEATAKQLRRYLTEPGQTPEVLREAEKLYQWIIAPIEPALTAQNQLKTLVFVPDGVLRNIPMGVLYDGNQYLLEKAYAIATAPRLELFQPKPLSPNLTVLAGGVGIPQVIQGTAFSEIEQLEEEIAQIPAKLLATPPLLDQTFTIANIEQRLQTGRYSAIHWKTHGIFSSDPTETYIVAYQSSIRIRELVQIVQSARERRAEPLELLVLSACETASGDNRAVLGMAGAAMNAGASSILSTLWRADDAANTTLMAEFYRALSNSGITRAAALQQAQLALLREYGYPAPYYWATYVLVGNWL